MTRDAVAKFVGAIILLVPRIALSQNLAPLSIAREGYVYAGGKYSIVMISPGVAGLHMFRTLTGLSLPVENNGRQVMSGQLYAEYQIPNQLGHPYPIVMVHGAGSSGANFMGTPDGREGWAQFFLRQGYVVYVIPPMPFNSGSHALRTTICGLKRICIRSGRGPESQATAVLMHSWHRACLLFLMGWTPKQSTRLVLRPALI